MVAAFLFGFLLILNMPPSISGNLALPCSTFLVETRFVGVEQTDFVWLLHYPPSLCIASRVRLVGNPAKLPSEQGERLQHDE